jgi:hypothetical protein
MRCKMKPLEVGDRVFAEYEGEEPKDSAFDHYEGSGGTFKKVDTPGPEAYDEGSGEIALQPQKTCTLKCWCC